MLEQDRSDRAIWLSVQARFDVGGGYYNPPEECVEIGRPLAFDDLTQRLTGHPDIVVTTEEPQTFHTVALWRTARSHLSEGEVLMGVYRNETHLFAVFIFDEERLLQFEIQVADWIVQRIGFYALQRTQADLGLMREYP